MVEYHRLEGQYDRVPAVVADLVRRRVAVIATSFTAAALAAKAATTTTPIVFGVVEDPVKLGLVTSLARPGGNVTGINFFVAEVMAKRLGLLHDLVPKAVRIAVRSIRPILPSPRPRYERYQKRHAASDYRFRSSRPAHRARSRRPSRPSCATEPTPCLLCLTRSSSAGASNLRRSRRAMGFPRSIPLASKSQPAG